MFIYWKYLDRMQSRPAAAASGGEGEGHPAFLSSLATKLCWQNQPSFWLRFPLSLLDWLRNKTMWSMRSFMHIYPKAISLPFLSSNDDVQDLVNEVRSLSPS